MDFRGFVDTGSIEIKPVTLLVGKNSSGKSSFLRALPMLRQSAEPNKKNPLVLNGRFVDLDDINSVMSRFSKNRRVGLSFSLSIEEVKKGGGYLAYEIDRMFDEDGISCEVYFSKFGERDNYVSEFSLKHSDIYYSIKISEAGEVVECRLNEFDCVDLFDDCRVMQHGLIPRVVNKKITDSNSFYYRFMENSDLGDRLVKVVKRNSNSKLSSSKIHTFLKFSRMTDRKRMITMLKSFDLFGSIWRKNVASWTTKSEDFIEIYRIYMASKVRSLMNLMNAIIAGSTSGIYYVTPIRATAERYYRFNDLSVDEIDSFGSNVPMFIKSLSGAERRSFQEWTNKYFGIKFEAESKGGHVSLFVDDGGGKTNLADTGFGYSQILPILIHLWKAKRKSQTDIFNEVGSKIFAIEQPELHLHPKMISKLADVISMIATADKELPISFVLETHSKTFIDRVGENVIAGVLKRNDVNVVLFDKQSSGSSTDVKQISFNEEGFLEDWPVGFLSADI
jgi:energy-coupling factor transporter ATP-binding protein EcfA2